MNRQKTDFTVVKVPFTKIRKKNVDYEPLMAAIKASNEVIFNGYMFLRSFIINQIEKHKPLDINDIFIRTVVNYAYVKKGGGRPPSNKQLLSDVEDFWKLFEQRTSAKRIECSNISFIIDDACKEILTSITNNLILHLPKHIHKYIKSRYEVMFKTEPNKDIKNLIKSMVNELLGKNIFYVKKVDIVLDNDMKWFINHTQSILKTYLPRTYEAKTFETDVSYNLHSYLVFSYTLNKSVQNFGHKSYQFFPVRTSYGDKYVNLNTSAIVNIFCNDGKGAMLNLVGDLSSKEKIWNTYFRLKRKKKGIPYKDCPNKIKRTGYSFNYELATDGYGVSLNFIKNDKIEKNEKSKKMKAIGRSQTAAKKKEFENDKAKYDEYIRDKKRSNEKKDKKKEEENKSYRAQKAKERKKLTREERIQRQMEYSSKKGFPYIDDLLRKKDFRDYFKDKYQNSKILFIDPGKRSLLYGISRQPDNVELTIPKISEKNYFGISTWSKKVDETTINYKVLNYTIRTYLKYTKIKSHMKKIQDWKKTCRIPLKRNISSIEKLLSEYSSKSCNLNAFMDYCSIRLFLNRFIDNYYPCSFLKYLRWQRYVSSLHHTKNLIDAIKKSFGTDIEIIIGDWSEFFLNGLKTI